MHHNYQQYAANEGEPIEANFIEIDTRLNSSEWILDSGASTHLTGDNAVFRKISTDSHSASVTTANGNKLPIAGQGSISVDANKDISKVLYVPGLQRNLFSIGTLADAI